MNSTKDILKDLLETAGLMSGLVCFTKVEYAIWAAAKFF